MHASQKYEAVSLMLLAAIRQMSMYLLCPYPSTRQILRTALARFPSERRLVQGPPYSAYCPWLAIAGLIFTGILVLWNINGALIMGALCRRT